MEESIGDNLWSDDLLDDNNSAHIDSNIDINLEAKSNFDKNITGGNLLKDNSEINIEHLFQRVWD